MPLCNQFDYVSDLTRRPEWSGGQLKIEAITPWPIAVGKEYMIHGDVAGYDSAYAMLPHL